MQRGRIGLTVVGVVILVLACGLFSRVSFLVPVDQGERCAVTNFGQLVGEAGPGLHWRWPMITGYQCFSVRDVVYETSDQPDQSQADYRDFAVPGQTSDGQQISVKYSVRFYADPNHVQDLYANVGQNMGDVNERVIKFHSRSLVRLTMQKYEALTLYSGNLIDVQNDIEKEMQRLAAQKYTVVDAFVLRKIDFDPDYVDAVEKKQIAFEGIQTAKYNAEQAVNEAQKKVNEAKGDAEAQIIAAQAEAQAIELKGQALRTNPQVIQYTFVEQLQGVQWGIMPFSGNTTPLIQIPSGGP